MQLQNTYKIDRITYMKFVQNWLFFFLNAVDFWLYTSCIVASFLLFTIPVNAYIDPSVMTYAIQAVAGMVIGLGAFFSVYWRSAKKKLTHKYNLGSNNTKNETNKIYFNDPDTNEKIVPKIEIVSTEKEDTSVTRKTFKEWVKEFVPAIPLLFAGSFLVSIFAPLEFYFGNSSEFDFDFYNLFPQLFKLFILLMLIGIVVFILSKLIYERLFQLGLLFTFWIFICTYVQGSFLSGNLPAMDGTTIDWSAFKADSIISVVVWLIIGLAITLLTRFFHMEGMKKIIKFSSIFITAILFVTLVVVSINQNGLARKNNVVATSDKEFTYSNDKNFIVLVLDMVDSQTFREILEEKNGEWESVLEDFTYYPNTTCAYPYTKHAIPHLLTNEWYLNEGDLDEFTLDAMKTSPLFETLEGNDYKMGLYEAYVKYDQECVDRFENIAVLPYEFSSFKDVIKKELKLVWFKYAPYPLKKFVNIKVDDFNNIRKANEEIKPFEYFNDTFYDSINNEEIVKIDDKCFKFIHIEGAHMPFRFDENVNPISEEEGTYELMMKCSMTITKAYLEKLKEAGVYDNSGIIIMTDHGYQNGREPRVLSRSNGFLVVKGINEQHEMYIDEAPISYEDIHEAFQRVIAGKQGDEVFDAKTGDARKRRYIWYNGPTDYDHMVEYIQTGYASDTSTMIETGNYYDYSE